MPFSLKIREEALVACGRHCCLCHKYSGTKMQVHHIKQEAQGGSNDLENAIPLCLDCHAEVQAYNPDHPIGTPFSESQLKRLRDNWYTKVADSPAITGAENFIEQDTITFFKLNEYLPNATLEWLRAFDFGGSFRCGTLEKIEFFPNASVNPIYEYLDMDLEAAKVELADSISTFTQDSISYLFTDGGYTHIPPEWMGSFYEKFCEGVDILNKDSLDIWNKYCSYIKLCRRKLKIKDI